MRAGIAYVVIGWALAQVAQFAVETFDAPEWTLQIFVVFLLLGLPLVLFLAWAFELTPEGVKREKDVDRSKSTTSQTGRKLDRIIIGVLVVAVGLLLVDKFYLDDNSSTSGEIVATQRQSIAVLPFVNMSDDPDHFSDGLTEELMNLLAKNPDLKVAGRTSSFAFKGQTPDFQEVGQALNVEHVLEGSVRRSGDTLRVTAQLIKVDDGYHVWSETYDREMADIFDIQDDVSASIADELQLQFSSQQARPTDNADAYVLYLQAVALLNSNDDGVLARAQSFLDQALSIDGDFAKAYELKASLYWFQAGWTLDAPAAQLKAYDAAMKALELDPSLSAARSFATTADPENWSWERELEALEELIRTEPDFMAGYNALTYDLVFTGYFDEALIHADRMIELEPLSSEGYWRRGEALRAAGRRQEAHASWTRAVELGDPISAYQMAADLLQSGDDEHAVEWLQRYFEAVGLDPADAHPFIENVRNTDSGKAFLDAYVEQAVARATNVDELRLPYFWYLHFGYLDDFWNAIDLLDDPDSAWTNTDTLEHQGIVGSDSGYRQHPRYLERTKSEKITDLWDRRGAPDFCGKESGEWVCE